MSNLVDITFKHYRTGEELTKRCEELPEYNKQPQNEVLIVYNHTDDNIDAIIKDRIVKIEAVNK